MARESLKTLTEQMYYVLLALYQPRHGYAVMQYVERLTSGRLKVGAATLYALLSRFEGEGLIAPCGGEESRRKVYEITARGKGLLREEYARINAMARDARRVWEEDETDGT